MTAQQESTRPIQGQLRVGNGTRRRSNSALGGGKGGRVISWRESPLMDGLAPNATVPIARTASLRRHGEPAL
jgi:hypothetical protein